MFSKNENKQKSLSPLPINANFLPEKDRYIKMEILNAFYARDNKESFVFWRKIIFNTKINTYIRNLESLFDSKSCQK